MDLKMIYSIIILNGGYLAKYRISHEPDFANYRKPALNRYSLDYFHSAKNIT
jgi:hypothetical protein